MPEDTPKSPVVWNELMTSDVDAAASFYCALFGWSTEVFHPAPGADYLTLQHDGRGFAGIMPVKQSGTAPYWVNYVGVESLEASLEKAVSLGAKTLLPPMSIGDAGRIAIVSDPQGAPIGLHEYKAS